MKHLLLATLLLPGFARALSWQEASTNPQLKLAIQGDGRTHLKVQVDNGSKDTVKIDLPAGLVAVGKNSDHVVVIRGTTLEIPAGKAAEADLPSVPLSARNDAPEQPFSLQPDAAPVLKPLVQYSASQNDLPRTTAQLAALLLTEDVTFAQWQTFLRRAPSAEPRPTPADIAAAVDAIAIARQLAPDRKFTIMDDGEFRLRAVRNPWSRAKAMQLFGMAAPEGVPVPDVNQLLHTRPGDNCPICRMRAQSAEPSNGL